MLKLYNMQTQYFNIIIYILYLVASDEAELHSENEKSEESESDYCQPSEETKNYIFDLYLYYNVQPKFCALILKQQEKLKQISCIKQYPEYKVSMKTFPNNYELQLFGLWCIIFDDLHEVANIDPMDLNDKLASNYNKVIELKEPIGNYCSERVKCWFENTTKALKIFIDHNNAEEHHDDSTEQIYSFWHFCDSMFFLLDVQIEYELSLGEIVSDANNDGTDHTNPKKMFDKVNVLPNSA
ncbi:hypothetical protein COBT_003220 [Conglomerata obtusa]